MVETQAAGMKLLNADSVIEAEHHFIDERRKASRATAAVARDASSPGRNSRKSGYIEHGAFNTVGLALSGGGIRSAAFCTGATQALAKHGLFPRIDYLSTVSGGGYLGTAVSVAMTRNGGYYPFFDKDEKQDTPAMRQLRANANYLRSHDPFEMLKNLAIYLRGIAANVLIVGPVLLLLAAITLRSNPNYFALSQPDIFGVPLENFLRTAKGSTDYFAVTKLAAVLAFGVFCFWSLSSWRSGVGELKSRTLKVATICLAVVAAIAFFELQPRLVAEMIGPKPEPAVEAPGEIHDLAFQLSPVKSASGEPSYQITVNPKPADAGTGPKPKAELPYARLYGWIASLLAPLVAAAGLLGPYIGQFLRTGEQESGWMALVRRYAARIFVWVAALALPLLLWYACLVLIYWCIPAAWKPPGGETPAILQMAAQWVVHYTGAEVNPYVPIYVCGFLLGAVLWKWLYPNSNSPHRLYRERLGEAFCALDGNDVSVKVSQLNTALGPYHIINTALNVQGSVEVNSRGRNADFFLFSPLFTGSDATGYVPTNQMEDLVARTQDASMDMATVMAISGAAASSNMGSQSIRPLTATLALLNVRLGYCATLCADRPWSADRNEMGCHQDPVKAHSGQQGKITTRPPLRHRAD